MDAIDRREFLLRTAATGALAFAAAARRTLAQEAAAGPTPPARGLGLRELGSTGRTLPCLGLGCTALANLSADDRAIAVVARAHELGVRFFDAAPDENAERAETLLGRAFRGVRRDELWISIRMDVRRADAAKRALEQSLARLGTDYVDAVLIPAVKDREAASESNSSLDELRRQQSLKTVRHIGISSSKSPTYAKRAIERFPYALALVPVNPGDPARGAFVTEFLPFADEKRIAVIATQLFVAGKRAGEEAVSRNDCVRYALGQPQVDVILANCASVESVDEMHAAAAAFVQPTDEELRAMEQRVSGAAGAEPAGEEGGGGPDGG